MTSLIPGTLPIESVPLDRLTADPVTDFALSPPPQALADSIARLGVQTPLVACRRGDRLAVCLGHRRLALLKELGGGPVPVRLIDPDPGGAEKLLLQLQDNRPHRDWSDMEVGRALIRLTAEGLDEDRLLDDAMPLLGQEPSKKRLEDFRAAFDFSKHLQTLLHELNLPLRVYSALYPWQDADRNAIAALFESLRPGAGKCRDLLELIDEAAHRDGITPAERLKREDVQNLLHDAAGNTGDRYQAVHRILFEWRYPNLNELRVRVRQALEQMKLDGRIRMRVPENFESDAMKVEFTFQSRQEFVEKVESLFRLTDHKALDDLLKIFE